MGSRRAPESGKFLLGTGNRAFPEVYTWEVYTLIQPNMIFGASKLCPNLGKYWWEVTGS